MTWTSADAEGHTSKASTPKLQKQWSDVVNSARDRCMKDGGNDKECSAKAIMMANGVIAKMMEEDTKNTFFYLSDLTNVSLEDINGKKMSWIEIFREGKWNHPVHGVIEGSKKLFNDFINNWKNNILGREVAFDKTHDPSEGAVGWLKELQIVGDRLKALVEWTPWGLDLIQNKGFKYFSPEYRDSYTEKESGKVYQNVLFGGGLTNRPFLTNLSPIVLSEDFEKNLTSLCQPMGTLQPSDENPYQMDLAGPFLTILRELVSGGYVDISELKDFIDTHLEKVDFANLINDNDDMMMSEQFKSDITKCLDDYFNKEGE